MNIAQETLDALNKALATPSDEIRKSAPGWQQSADQQTGLTFYDLEAPAKTLYPVLTPLRNEIPRVSGKGGIQANWKAVTGVNVKKIGLGVMEGARGRIVTTTVKEYFAAYRGLGLEDFVTFEAQYAGKGYEDIRARSTEGLLRSFMIGEEMLILGGNGSRNYGVTAQPTVATAAGGALAAADYNVICIGLTLEAYLASNLADGVPVSGNATTADGQNQFVKTGTMGKSPAATITVAANGLITATVPAQAGIVGYAWYVGLAGAEKLEAITNINSVSVSSLKGTGQAAADHSATDYSANDAVFDGFLTVASNSLYGGYQKIMATGTAGQGTGLTSSGDGGIAEFDEALQWFWDNWRISPDEILVGSQESKNIKAKIMDAPATAAQRFVFTMSKDGVVGGSSAVSYLNNFQMGTAKEIPIKLHPNMPNGTVMFRTKQLPYQASGVPNVAQIIARQDYYSIEWPLRTRKYEMGVYADECMQVYAPFAFGVITNIANK